MNVLARRALLGATAALALSSTWPASAAGWGFVPTALDWQTWPMYCRVQYSYINRDANDYGNYYPDSAIAEWRSAIGEKTFIALHHFCKAMIIVRQARRETNPQQKRYLVGVAVDDGEFSYLRTDPKSIVYPVVASTMAEARFLNGEFEDAVSILRRAIESQPDRFEAYATLARLHRERGDVKSAIAVIREANAATGGQSAEVRYSLGLLHLESGDVDAAVEDARVAYANGYPLEGLKNKLSKLGRWPPPEKTVSQ